MTSVAVVIPCRDRAELLVRCLRSIESQTVAPTEVIVVDDGSTPDLENRLSGAFEPRVPLRFIRSNTSRGAATSRNVGAESATSDLIAFQDSDDVWLPTKLETQLHALESAGNPPNAVVYTGVTRVLTSGDKAVFPPNLELRHEGARLLRGNFISTQTTLIPRSHFRQFEFDPELPRLQDWELWLRMSATTRFIAVPEYLVNSYETSLSISTNSSAYDRALPHLLKRHRATFNKDPDALAHFARAAAAGARRQNSRKDMIYWLAVMAHADARGTASLMHLRLPSLGGLANDTFKPLEHK